MHNNILRAGFPTSILLKNKTLLNPSNLETTQEYYLLENLSATMLRYSADLSSDFIGYIAETWFVTGDEATFKLKSNLKWSDGSPITCMEIADHYSNIIKKPHRHLQAFKKISKVYCSKNDSAITFKFNGNPPSTFFHELTLADTGLIKQLVDLSSWEITSGPYAVSFVDKTKNEVHLIKNKNAPLSLPSNTPEKIVLREIPYHLQNPFEQNDVNGIDYASPQGWSFHPKVTKLIQDAPFKIEGRPSLIHFISFIRANKQVRETVKFAVLNTNSNHDLKPKNTTIYHEMIPPGYNGFLNINLNLKKETDEKLNEKLTIVVRQPYEYLSPWLEQLKREGKKLGLSINIEFGDITDSTLEKRDGNLAVLGLFKGNLKDPVGSWSFLSDKNHGVLRGYSSFVESYIKKAIESKDEITKDKVLSDLHRSILEQNMMIPLWCENIFMLHNDKISDIKSNPFDFRIHFYEISLRQ